MLKECYAIFCEGPYPWATAPLCETLLATVHIWKWSFKTGNFVLLFTKQGGLWLGMTGGLSTQVKMNVKPIGAF